MKIRQRITLWITGAGILVGLLASSLVFLEMVEQPYDLIDKELDIMAEMVIHLTRDGRLPLATGTSSPLPFDTSRYWITIYDARLHPIFSAGLTRYADLPLRDQNRAYSVKALIPLTEINLDQEEGNEVSFRSKVFHLTAGNLPYILQIAKPIQKLDDEIMEILVGILLGLAGASLLLLLLGYGIARKILRPIKEINALARQINDDTLDRRIPLPANRDELYELTRSLNRMFDRLQASTDRQKQFIANASHELKSPLTLLMLFVEEACQRHDLPEDLRLQLLRQSDILRRMSRLVKDLLNLSALELQNTIQTREIDLAGLTRTTLAEYEEAFAGREISCTADLPVQLLIEGDRDGIQRMLINLLDNAIKYNRPDGSISLDLVTEDGMARLEIFNTGLGLAAEDLERVFERFYRVEKSRADDYGGAGLGLSIARRIVELHGGSIRMTSDGRTWTRVIVLLPRRQPMAA